MNHIRDLSRTASRRIGRRTAHVCLRRAWRCVFSPAQGPDQLSQALTAFSRAVTCHRRLAKIAPRFFDSVTIREEERERLERARWRAIYEPVINKVYGLPADTPSEPDPADAPPPLPGRRTRRVVERELAQLDLWMLIGHNAMDRWRVSRPHQAPSLAQVDRLIRVADALAALSCGLDTRGKGSAQRDSGQVDTPFEDFLPMTDYL